MTHRFAFAVNACAVLSFLSSCAASVSPGAAVSAAEPKSWPMYQLQPDHNPIIERTRPLHPWRFNAGARINGGLAVVGNTVFLDTFGKELIALDVRAGRVLWRARADNILMSTPIVSEGLVYVGSGDNSRLSGAGGSSTYAPPRGDFGSAIWGRPEGDALLAFDAATGAKRWQFQTVGEDMPSAAYAHGQLFFANGDLHMYSVAAKTGQQRWVYRLDGLATMSSATFVEGKILVSVCSDEPYRCHTLAVRAVDHRVLWSSPFGNSDSSPTYCEGLVLVSGIIESREPRTHSGRAIVAALDVASGQSRWLYLTKTFGPYTEVGSSERAISGACAYGRYYQAIPTHDTLVAFDAQSGQVLWQFHSIAPIKMSPIISLDRLYVGDTGGVLYEINPYTGKLLGSALFKEPFTTSPPVMIGNNLLVSDDTTVYSIRL